MGKFDFKFVLNYLLLLLLLPFSTTFTQSHQGRDILHTEKHFFHIIFLLENVRILMRNALWSRLAPSLLFFGSAGGGLAHVWVLFPPQQIHIADTFWSRTLFTLSLTKLHFRFRLAFLKGSQHACVEFFWDWFFFRSVRLKGKQTSQTKRHKLKD